MKTEFTADVNTAERPPKQSVIDFITIRYLQTTIPKLLPLFQTNGCYR